MTDIIGGEVFMRKRQKADRVRYYCFIERQAKKREGLDEIIHGWVMTTHKVGQEPEYGFIRDEDMDGFLEKKRNIRLPDEEVAKLLLSGVIDVGILQTIQKQEG